MSRKSSRPTRSLTDIRTVAGKGSDASQRGYTNYFEMGALELERLRRSQEREVAMRRVSEIDRRIEEIDAQMARLRSEVDANRAQRAEQEGAVGARQASPSSSRRRTASHAASQVGASAPLRSGVARAEPTESAPRSGLRIRY